MTARGRAPAVSVVIPTRDRPRLLADAVACVERQRDVAIELIVVDDGSLDAVALSRPPTGAVVSTRVARHEHPRGDAAARNSAIAAAEAPWTAFLDDDDLWAPDKLARQLAALDAAAGCDYAYCGAVELDGRGGVIKDHPAPDPGRILTLLRRRNVMPAGSSNVIVRSAVLRALGGFDTGFANLSDWDLWLRLAERGPAACSPETLVAYRRHVIDGAMAGEARSEHTLLERTDELLAQLRALELKHGSAGNPLRVDRGSYARWIVAGGARRSGRSPAAARLYLSLGWRARSARTVAAAAPMLLGERTMGTLLRWWRRPAPAPDWVSARAAGPQDAA